MELTKSPSGAQAWKSFCDHCGNLTLQNILAVEVTGEPGNRFSFTFSRCTICDGIILHRQHGDWNVDRIGHDSKLTLESEPDQLWPSPLGLPSQVPSRVRNIYDEARLVKRQSPCSFVVQIRRALEAVANHKNAEGRSLFHQIQFLISNETLPGVFADMTNIARMIGNLGAHDSEREVTGEDARVADDFFRAVIEYLYVAPALVSRVRSNIE